MKDPSNAIPAHPLSGSPEVHTGPALGRLKETIASACDWASKLNEEILTPNTRALMATAHPNPKVAIIIVAPFLLSAVLATAFVTFSFLSVIGFAFVAITVAVAVLFIGALVSVAVKTLVVVWAEVTASVIPSDIWQNRSNILKYSRSIIIAVVSSVGALLLTKLIRRLFRKLFRLNNNKISLPPFLPPQIHDRPIGICRGPHQRWPPHVTAATRPLKRRVASLGGHSASSSKIIRGSQLISTPSWPMKVVGKVARIAAHIIVYIVRLVHRAIIRAIGQSIRTVLHLVWKISVSRLIFVSLVVYVFILHYKLRKSNKARRNSKMANKENIEEDLTAE